MVMGASGISSRIGSDAPLRNVCCFLTSAPDPELEVPAATNDSGRGAWSGSKSSAPDSEMLGISFGADDFRRVAVLNAGVVAVADVVGVVDEVLSPEGRDAGSSEEDELRDCSTSARASAGPSGPVGAAAPSAGLQHKQRFETFEPKRRHAQEQQSS